MKSSAKYLIMLYMCNCDTKPHAGVHNTHRELNKVLRTEIRTTLNEAEVSKVRIFGT